MKAQISSICTNTLVRRWSMKSQGFDACLLNLSIIANKYDSSAIWTICCSAVRLWSRVNRPTCISIFCVWTSIRSRLPFQVSLLRTKSMSCVEFAAITVGAG